MSERRLPSGANDALMTGRLILIIATQVIFVQHTVCFKVRFSVIIKRSAKPGGNL